MTPQEAMGTHHPICQDRYATMRKRCVTSWKCECDIIKVACAWQREQDAETANKLLVMLQKKERTTAALRAQGG